MAKVEMTIVVLPSTNVENEYAYEYQDDLAAAGDGDWILIPADVRTVVATCEASGTTAKVQTTTDTIASIDAGTETAVDWDEGSVSTAVSAACDPPTAIRIVQDGAGTSKLTVRAQ